MQSVYSRLPYILDVGGSRYAMGYDMGFLTGSMIAENYQSLLSSLLGNGTFTPEEQGVLELFLDWQWESFLSVQTPTDYLTELLGVHDGASAVNVSQADTFLTRGIVLANFPGTITDLLYVLADELVNGTKNAHEAPDAARDRVRAAARAHAIDLEDLLLRRVQWSPLQCSMFGAWNSRTQGARLFTGRNLDWTSDTGINRYKMATVMRPTGKNAHVVLGFAGLLGALTGMSAAGLTVHEANLEEKQETFRGFPWLLRLRYVMENANNLAQAQALWQATNNTVGFNHGIGSAADNAMLIMETEAGYTAFFRDNDPREANAVVDGVHTGFPLVDAVWRTNHGYDPKIRSDFLWSQGPTSNTQNRYMIIHDALVDYATRNVPIGALEAVNITAVVGQKGANYFQCIPGTGGSNVLSVAFDPARLVLYSAWEAGTASTWSPACCNTYVVLDMNSWFAGFGPGQ